MPFGPTNNGTAALAAHDPSMTEGRSDLRRRTLASCVFVPLVLSLAWFGDWTLLVLVVAIVARASWEFFHLATVAGHRPARNLGIALCVGWCLFVAGYGSGELHLVFMGVALAVLVAALCTGVSGFVANASITLAGVVYVGLLGSAPLWIERDHDGHGTAGALICIVFACVWLTDSAAYLGGRKWGVRKLMPSVSPAKTRAGFIAGLVGGMVPVALYPLVPQMSIAELGGLLLVASFGGQLGDLVESALKRDFGVKDAPGIIPGHGGFLDRFDSYLFAFPLTYFYLSMMATLNGNG